MRILFVTNFYPPHERGGQGRSCQQVVEGLKRRGHKTAVLTSMYGTNNVPVEENGVSRHLYLEMDFVPWLQSMRFFIQRGRRERVNLERIDEMVEKFQPDVVFVWGMWNLPCSVPRHLERLAPDRLVYRFADYWPTLPSQHEMYWRKEGRTWYSRLPKRLIAGVALHMLRAEPKQQELQFRNSICVSAATRDALVKAGVPVSDAAIIHTGLDLSAYDSGPRREQRNNGLDLLYAGRLDPIKGIDTAIRAIARLVWEHGLTKVKLNIAGSGDEKHVASLRQMVDELDVKKFVTFLGQVPYAEMPTLLGEHDVLLAPSVWPEPFARTPLEAMASRLVVVATAVGGTAELIEDGRNGLLFSPGDEVELAEKVVQLLEDPALRTSLAETGFRDVVERFTVDNMLDKIETVLYAVVVSDCDATLPEGDPRSDLSTEGMKETTPST